MLVAVAFFLILLSFGSGSGSADPEQSVTLFFDEHVSLCPHPCKRPP
eukprot:COSAG04_NODE_1119_length_8181_cov_3.025612_5_plen_47_part_00